jgi:hypothetical protein
VPINRQRRHLSGPKRCSEKPSHLCLWIRDTDDRATLGFTARGIESLKELSLDQKR